MMRNAEVVIRAASKALIVVSAGAMILSCSPEPSRKEVKAPLKEVFKDQFLVGAALNPSHFAGADHRGTELVKEQFNSITAENVLKWEVVHPKPEVYDFTASDQFVAFGEQNNMAVIGHTLVWHNQTPRWVFEDEHGKPVSRAALLERMREHIQKVVGRYKGRIKGWDVVNEAIVDDGSYIESSWLKIIGEEYIAKAFQFAHEADPDAELYYNDFSVENAPKREGVARLVKRLRAAGARVTGVGIQGHYKMNWPTAGQLDSTIQEFAGLGVKVLITELDIDILPQPDASTDAEITRRFGYAQQLDPYKDGLPANKQEELAARYRDLFKVLVSNKGKISRVTFWGVDDGGSWLNTFPIAGRTSYPLLFDRAGKPKPAFDAVVQTVL